MSDKMSELGVAMILASLAHHGQEDKAGKDYIHHPRRVAERVKSAGGSDSAQAVAWLHDTIEDTVLTLYDLTMCGFSDEVIQAVLCLTRRFVGAWLERYHDEFIQRIKQNPLARMVEIADLQDNLARLDTLPKDEAEGLKRRYDKALAVLQAEQPITLSSVDSTIFADALLTPPAPGDSLKQAKERYDERNEL